MGMVKDNANITGVRLPWAGKKVHTTNVDAELAYLWRMSADNVRTSQNMNVRTSVLNIVICAPDIATARRASMLLRELSSTHIARVILLILDPSGMPSSVSTWVTLRSFPIISDIMRHSFEQITVLATGAEVYEADKFVQSLLKQDLPVYLWWLFDLPTDKNILRRIGNICDRVIVDSSSFSTPEESIRALSSLVQTAPSCAISDLNWARIAPWRELIAQLFDVSDYKPYLAGVNNIAIEHAVATSSSEESILRGGASPNPIQALLLAAWLKTRLGWKLSSDDVDNEYNPDAGTYAWQMTSATGPLGQAANLAIGRTGKLSTISTASISLRPREQTDSPVGSICLVHMESTHQGKHATFKINRQDSQHVITSVQLDEGKRPPRTVNLASQEVTSLLHNELEIMSRDQMYEETLHEVLALLSH